MFFKWHFSRQISSIPSQYQAAWALSLFRASWCGNIRGQRQSWSGKMSLVPSLKIRFRRRLTATCARKVIKGKGRSFGTRSTDARALSRNPVIPANSAPTLPTTNTIWIDMSSYVIVSRRIVWSCKKRIKYLEAFYLSKVIGQIRHFIECLGRYLNFRSSRGFFTFS